MWHTGSPRGLKAFSTADAAQRRRRSSEGPFQWTAHGRWQPSQRPLRHSWSALQGLKQNSPRGLSQEATCVDCHQVPILAQLLAGSSGPTGWSSFLTCSRARPRLTRWRSRSWGCSKGTDTEQASHGKAWPRRIVVDACHTVGEWNQASLAGFLSRSSPSAAISVRPAPRPAQVRLDNSHSIRGDWILELQVDPSLHQLAPFTFGYCVVIRP